MINIPENVNRILKNETARKNFRVHFVNGEHNDLTSEHIESESVQLTESISNGGFSFGMCESSILTFNAVADKSLKGAEIVATLEVDISSEPVSFVEEYGHTSLDVPFVFFPILYGNFIVRSCKKGKNGLRSFECYTQLYGDKMITANGTVDFTEYGLSEIELMKMNAPFITNADYSFELSKFLKSNIQTFSEPIAKTELATVTEEKTTYIGLKRIRINGVWREGSHLFPLSDISIKLNDARYQLEAITSKRLLYFDGGTGAITKDIAMAWIDECFREQYGDDVMYEFEEYTHEQVAAIICNHVEFNFAFSTDKKKPILSGGTYIYPHAAESGTTLELKTVMPDKIELSLPDKVNPVSGESVTYTKYTRQNGSGAKLYVDMTQQESEITVTLPRTKSGNGYIVDYKSLFGDGVTITTKDRKGNTVTKTYKFSMRDMIEGFSEINAQIGAYWRRKGAFDFLPLNDISRLYPSENLYPDTALYPAGASEFISINDIEDAEWNDEITKPYGKVVCTCTPAGASEETVLEVDIFDLTGYTENDYLTYDLSSNYIISAFPAAEAEIMAYMQKIAAALANLRYMPVDMMCRGIPQVEAGDFVEFETPDGTMHTIVMGQRISGVQNLKTTIESEDK